MSDTGLSGFVKYVSEWNRRAGFRDATAILLHHLHAINDALNDKPSRRERKILLAQFEGVRYALGVLNDTYDRKDRDD